MICLLIWVLLCGMFTVEDSSSCILIDGFFLIMFYFSGKFFFFFNKAALSEDGFLQKVTEQLLWSPWYFRRLTGVEH